MEPIQKIFCKIIYNSTKNYLNIYWIGFPPSNDFRDACMKVLDFKKNIKQANYLPINIMQKYFRLMIKSG